MTRMITTRQAQATTRPAFSGLRPRVPSTGLVAGGAVVDGEKHAMLGRAPLWHQLSTGFVLGALLDIDPCGTVPGPAAKIVSRALAGDARLEV